MAQRLHALTSKDMGNSVRTFIFSADVFVRVPGGGTHTCEVVDKLSQCANLARCGCAQQAQAQDWKRVSRQSREQDAGRGHTPVHGELPVGCLDDGLVPGLLRQAHSSA